MLFRSQPWNADNSVGSTDEFGFQGQGSFSWTGDFAGKVWAGFFTQEVTNINSNADVYAAGGDLTNTASERATAFEAGVSTSIYNINLVAYAYSGEGVGTTALLQQGFDANGDKRDSDGGYLQATYVIPTGTKLGVSYGISKLDDNAVDAGTTLVEENKRLTIGAYHPLTKHLNLVAEFSNIEAESHNGLSNEEDKISLGAILFF